MKHEATLSAASQGVQMRACIDELLMRMERLLYQHLSWFKRKTKA